MNSLPTQEDHLPTYTAYKGRRIDPSKKVRLYRNLNNGKISIKQGALVVGHTDAIIIKEATFIVQESNRQKVLEKRQKNVHAFIEGYCERNTPKSPGESVWYNPYKTEFFRTRTTNDACHLATLAQVTADGRIQVWR